ncbi:unnamed protein product [Rotaria sordida]|uniref:Uncharacterized protein n=1 Tax=Rotaria sordida TaxID=392033 RepID=A0A815P6R2_9BILA|nr:unnamed protein product [Rotaria sordida]CAF1444844.1 unnamed protein product [Rotaria sordida]
MRSSMEKTRNIKSILSFQSITSPSKIKPLNDDNFIDTIAHSTELLKNINLDPVSTTKKKPTNSKFRCSKRSFLFYLILPVVLILLITVSIVVPVVSLLSKTTTTILTTSNTLTSSTSTSATTSTSTSTTTSTSTSTTTSTSTSTTSSSSSSTTTSSTSTSTKTTTSTTTASTTSTTTTTTAATVTITSNICTVNWSGIKMIANCVNCSTMLFYYNYVTTYTAIGTSTRIAFSFRRNNGYFALDNLSVRSFTAPSTELLVNGGFEMGDLTGWSYCSQDNSSMTGGVKGNSSNFTYLSFTFRSQSGSYYYVGGGTTYADYISQTFSSTIGALYTVSLWILISGTGPLNDAALFLGI